MNNIFNGRRMSLYIRKHYIENAKFYYSLLIILFAAIFFLNFFEMNTSRYKNVPTTPFFYYILLPLGILPTTMKPFYSRGKKIQALTLPVSRFEQFLLTLLTPIIIWIMITAIHLYSVYILNLHFKLEYNFLQHFYHYWTSPNIISTYLLFTGLTIWSVSGCKKHPLQSYLYTFIKYICFQLIIFLPWITKSITLHYKSINELPPYLYFYAFKSSSAPLRIDYHLSWLSEQQITTITILFAIIAFTVFLLSAYYRHRENQVK